MAQIQQPEADVDGITMSDTIQRQLILLSTAIYK